MNEFVRSPRHEGMVLNRNKYGYTLFFGEIIASDAPYERLKVDNVYKMGFIEMLKEWAPYVESEDKVKLEQWIAEVEELEE